MDNKRITVAVAGNPNVGKSALFNTLTGSHQHTGNWPGKTVERAEGVFQYLGWEIRLVDLPGTYSLAAQSPEEVIARDYILSGEPDLVIDIVDATSLERNLNLTLQLLELTDRVVVALNLMDEVKRQGWEINVAALEADLGVPVVPTIATEGEGLPELVAAIVEIATGRQQTNPAAVDYGLTVEGHVESLAADLAHLGIDGRRRWVALKLLEDDPQITGAFQRGDLAAVCGGLVEGAEAPSSEASRALLNRAVRLREGIRPDAKVEIVRRRFEFAHDVVHKVARRLYPAAESLTERIDRIVTHKVWSWPIMLAMLLLLFWITIKGGEIGGMCLEAGFAWLIRTVRTWLVDIQAPWWVSGALVDGLLMGTGTVISAMLPPMVILFVAFDLLEDLGLLPRMAFNLDRPMQVVGSQGKQCLAWGMCLGCNVTGVMAARIIEIKRPGWYPSSPVP